MRVHLRQPRVAAEVGVEEDAVDRERDEAAAVAVPAVVVAAGVRR